MALHPRQRSRFSVFMLLLGAVLATGCQAGRGHVTLTAYGEELIEEGIPASEVDDGWAISFDRFLVQIRGVRVAGAPIPVSGPVDLTVPSSGRGQSLGRASVPEGAHDDARFVIDRLEVEGEATRGDVRKTFSWIFDEPTTYEPCEPVVTVKPSTDTTMQITVQADHLFFDSLVAEEPALIFQPLADADANSDGEITQDELTMTDLGGHDPGSEGGIDDLWSFLRAQARTVGHLDGEGHCETEPTTP